MISNPAVTVELLQFSCRQGSLAYESRELTKHDEFLIVTHAVTLRIVKAILEQTLPDHPHGIAGNGEIWKAQFTGLGNIHEVESIFLGGSKAATSRA